MYTAHNKYPAQRPELISDYKDELGNEDVIIEEYSRRNILRRLYDYCHPWLCRTLARIEDYGSYTKTIKTRSS